jgi:hypothetical protein
VDGRLFRQIRWAINVDKGIETAFGTSF